MNYLLMAVMLDNSITIEAKAIYAYIYSFCFPNKEEYLITSNIIRDLGINKERFYKHRKILTEKGLLAAEPVKERGKVCCTMYSLIGGD